MDKTLYKLNKRGKLQMWRIYTKGNQYFTEDWIIDGKVKHGKPTTAKPKNVGRANATSAIEQAEAEAKAKITKKLNQGGYVEDAENASMYASHWEPMLADTREPIFPCWAQPKLDGGRNCYRDYIGQTREGKDYFTIRHITNEIKQYLPAGWILDGELYNHDLHDDFPKIMSLIKKQKPTVEEIFEAEQKVQYWVYDILTGEDDDSTEDERINRREQWFKDNPEMADYIVCVPTKWVENQEALDEIHKKHMEAGFEGTMLRTPTAKYKRGGRSKDLLKFKDFIDDEFEIISILEGKGNRSGEAGTVVCKTAKGNIFGAGIKGDKNVRVRMWFNTKEYIGRKATITFFGYTKQGGDIPRFPVYKGINERE